MTGPESTPLDQALKDTKRQLGRVGNERRRQSYRRRSQPLSVTGNPASLTTEDVLPKSLLQKNPEFTNPHAGSVQKRSANGITSVCRQIQNLWQLHYYISDDELKHFALEKERNNFCCTSFCSQLPAVAVMDIIYLFRPTIDQVPPFFSFNRRRDRNDPTIFQF